MRDLLGNFDCLRQLGKCRDRRGRASQIHRDRLFISDKARFRSDQLLDAHATISTRNVTPNSGRDVLDSRVEPVSVELDQVAPGSVQRSSVHILRGQNDRYPEYGIQGS